MRAQQVAADNEKVWFLVQREGLKQRLVRDTDEATSWSTKLKACVAQFQDKHGSLNVKDLPHTNEELMKVCKALIDKFSAWRLESQACEESNDDALVVNAENCEQDMAAFGVKAKKQLETVAYMKANKGSESRVAYQSRRWRIARLVQGFVQGQFETGFAGVLAKAVNAMYDEKHAGKSQERSGLEVVSKVDISVNIHNIGMALLQVGHVYSQHTTLSSDLTIQHMNQLTI